MIQKVGISVILSVCLIGSFVSAIQQRQPCPHARPRSDWLRSSYHQGDHICPVTCCSSFGYSGISVGCRSQQYDYKIYECCDRESKRVKVKGKYKCIPKDSLISAEPLQLVQPWDYPGYKCPSKLVEKYPIGFKEEHYINDESELCEKECFVKTEFESKNPPFYYYPFVSCCKGWKKYKVNGYGKYLCLCEGRLTIDYRTQQLVCHS